MEVTTEEEYYQRRQENLNSEEFFSNANGLESIGKVRSYWSLDNYRQVELPSGFYLEISDETFHRDLNLISEHDRFYAIVSKFYLSGHHTVISPPGIEGVETSYAETGGHHYLFYLPQLEEIEQFHRGDRLFKLIISTDLEFLRTFCTNLDDVPQLLRPAIESNAAPQFHRPVGKLTPAMKTIIQQIWQTPYRGAIGRMYLEGKVLELVALQLAQLRESDREKPPSIHLKPNDIERIYQAKEILIQQYANPPLLIDLAKQVDVNDCKLKQGFRHVFGTTVFGYLHQHRMELAKQLLQEGHLSVGAVANAVGYATQGRFAIAFKRKFGITPKECRLGNLSNIVSL
jgi:AraC family transcriptional regulator, transcriptional activator of the genes for pyochelin and ferripyochelin receptors